MLIIASTIAGGFARLAAPAVCRAALLRTSCAAQLLRADAVDGRIRRFEGPRYQHSSGQQHHGTSSRQGSADGDEGRADNKDLVVGMGVIAAAAAFGYFVYTKAIKDKGVKPLTSGTGVEQLLDSGKQQSTASPEVTSVPKSLPRRHAPEPHPKFSLKPGHPLPEKVPYLLIGAGTATFAALRAIRSREPNAKILILGAENSPPYMRPPLSKEFWFEDPDQAADSRTFKQWNGRQRSAFFEPDEYYMPYDELMDSAKGGVSLVTGVKVTRIDSESRKAYLEDGTKIGYSKCLLAPGAKPKTLPVLERASRRDPEVRKRWMVFRNLDDFEHLVQIVGHVRSLAVVGGGFLGSELACALGKVGVGKGVNVVQIFKEEGNLRAVLPGYLSEWSTKKVEDCGVAVLPNREIVDVKTNKDGNSSELILNLSNGDKLPVDFVVTCVGVEPNVEIGKASKLEVDDQFGGYIVNSEFAARTNLWVAGDASCFFDPLLGRRRVEHHDHAVVSGRLAGENMTGAAKNYKHQSMIWSDLGPEIGFEAVGLVDSRLPTVGIFARQKEQETSSKAKLDTNMRSEAEEGVSTSSLAGAMAGGPGNLVKGGPTITWPKGNPMHLVPSYDEVNRGTPSGDAAAASAESPGEVSLSPEYKKGVVFYTKDERVVGIVLWNIFSRMPLARRVLQEAITTEEIPEIVKLFHIHEDEQEQLE